MSKKNTIVNTTTQVAEAGLYAPLLIRGLQGRHPEGFIEGMEAEGARQMASQATQLPAKGSTNPAWEKMGVKFGDHIKGDEIFRSVQLPPGWSIKQTDHDMWTKLVDDKGRERAGIFYKAAFYDRSAHINPVPRYVPTVKNAVEGDYQGPKVAVVMDGDVEVYRSEPASDDPGEWSQRNHTWKSAYDKVSRLGEAWVKEHFPSYQDVSAYWD